MNHPLAHALRGVRLDVMDVAARLQVDPKTVRRWLTGRTPYPRHRATLAQLTGWSERDLWPHLAPLSPADAGSGEVRVVYPHRSAVPVDTWQRLFGRARREIGILAYSALALAEDATALRVLRDKAAAGVRVRIALGDPNGANVAQRGADERIADMMSARIRNALILYRPVVEQPGVELRLHDTVLYASLYRADDELLVNIHVYGVPASHAPVLHLSGTGPDGMAATYLDSFERAWTGAARPVR